MTGEYMDEARKKAELGGAACLQKPFRILDALAELREALLSAYADKPPDGSVS